MLCGLPAGLSVCMPDCTCVNDSAWIFEQAGRDAVWKEKLRSMTASGSSVLWLIHG